MLFVSQFLQLSVNSEAAFHLCDRFILLVEFRVCSPCFAFHWFWVFFLFIYSCLFVLYYCSAASPEDMAEKGGKWYSQPKVGKSALKTPSSFLGKDNDSAKSKRGMNVQFESEDGWGKGGKGGKTANGGKSPVKKPIPPLELRVEEELPKETTCLMDCEAAQILEGIQEQMVVLSEDPKIKIPISFDKGLQHAKRGSDYASPQSVRRVLQSLKKHGVADSEMCMIANIHPESIDEVFALVPSFKGKQNKLREPLKYALDELAKLKEST